VDGGERRVLGFPLLLFEAEDCEPFEETFFDFVEAETGGSRRASD
jgi:hypothetical protein